MVAAYLVVNLLLSIPVLLCAARARSPLAVAESGARFAGPYSGWVICTFTGWVTSSRSHSEGYDDADGRWAWRVTDVLRLTDGTAEFAVPVDDFDVWLHPGQAATVCQAVNGRRSACIAVINDSTGEQFYNERGLWRVASPSPDRLLLAVLAGMVFWLLLIAVVALAMVTRSQVRRFQYTGVGPLLRRANAEAGELRRPWAA
jgi:hypothetical protein